MKKTLLVTIIILLFVYISLGTLLFNYQRKLVYFPTPVVKHNYAELIFNNEGESISVIVLNRGNKKAILYFGGNAESVFMNAADFSQLFSSHTVYLINYRGYGGSSGQPEEKANYSDAQAIYQKIKHQYSDISVIGRSLGSGVATYLASKNEINKLVLITPFDSIQSVAQEMLFIYPISLLLTDKYDSLSRVKDIKAKTLVIIAENDQIIKRKHTNRLIKAFPDEQIVVEILRNTDHNNFPQNNRYYEVLKQFL
jgi:pimeloyl-ACP methyl ester carboxylesterase